jgi:ABC-2 type transport system permease protein
MEKGKSYFIIQLKRMFKSFPAVFIITIAMAACIGGLAYLYMKNGIFSEEQQRYHIGIVGDLSDTYLGFGIYAVESLDTSRYMIEFENLTEAEAKDKLRKGELTAYICVPDGFVESIVSGENDRKITYVTSEGQEGVTGILMDELSEIASTLVTRSQSAVYGMQNLMWKNGMGDNIKDAEIEISKKYIAMLLKRTKLCEVEDIGVANDLSISLEEFYACSLTLFLILIFGINSSYLFSHRNNELSKFMASRNVGVVKQILSEYFSYVCLLLACVVGIFVLAGINILPVIAMFAAIHFFIYELVD